MNHEVIIDFVKVTGCRIASIAVSAQGCVEGTARHIVERVVPLSAPGRGPLPSTLPSPSSSLPSPQEGLGHARGTAPDNRVGAVNAGPASRSNPGSGATHSAEDGVGEEKNSQDLTWRINEGLAGLKEHEKAALVENCNEVRHDTQQPL